LKLPLSLSSSAHFATKFLWPAHAWMRVPSTLSLAREQPFVLGLLQHPIEELDNGVVLDQTLAVLGEDGGHPHGIV